MKLAEECIELHEEKVDEKFKMPKFKSIKKLLKKFKKVKPVKKPKVAFDVKKAKKKQGKPFWKKFFEGLNEEYSKEQIEALAKHLEVEPDEVTDNGYGLEADGGEYIVLTDSEANDKLKEYIEESVWAFNTDFLEYHIDDEDIIRYYGLESSYYDEDTEEEVEIGDEEEVIYVNLGMTKREKIEELQGKYEDGNGELESLIGDFYAFVKDAEMSDGRGHFLSGYDGEEIELDGDLYAYRTN